MAGLAHIGGIDVRCALASGVGVVVTCVARIRCGAVIKHRHQPIGRDMTAVTGKRRRNMGCPFPAGNYAIMTAFASTDDLGMIH
jgi:hypothetical protein